MDDWQQLYAIRTEVNKALEGARQAGLIGSSLAAELELYADPAPYALLSRFKAELRFIMLSASAKVSKMHTRPHKAILCDALGIAIEIGVSSALKCGRCWQRCADVGIDAHHIELCKRCIANIKGADEHRLFA